MDVKAELKIIAKKHRWAFEELTFDLCMTQSNKMDGKYGEQFAYLKGRFGSGRQVLAEALKEFRYLKVPSPIGSEKEQLKQVTRYYPWVLDELTVVQKSQEAAELCGSVNEMYRFLITELQDAFTVWENVSWLILAQSGRRKTIRRYAS